jgi:hypothetical protein
MEPSTTPSQSPVGSRGTRTSGQPRHSHQWAAEALTPVGSRGTHPSHPDPKPTPLPQEAASTAGVAETVAYTSYLELQSSVQKSVVAVIMFCFSDR